MVNQSEPLELHINFLFNNLFSVDKIAQTIEHAWINLTWFDQIRTWDPNQYGGLSVITPSLNKFWYPKFFILTSRDKLDIVDSDMPCFLYHNGWSTRSADMSFTNYCVMDFTYYPFDTQTCEIIILFRELAVGLHLVESQNSLVEFQPFSNGEWDVTSQNINYKFYDYEDVEASMSVEVIMKRRPHLCIMKTIIPMALISGLSALVFLLPDNSGERVSYSSTMFLTLILFQIYVSDSLPEKTDNFPLILIYGVLLLALSTFSVLITVLRVCWCNKNSLGNTSGIDQDAIHLEINKYTFMVNVDFDKMCFFVYVTLLTVVNVSVLALLVNN